MKRFLQISAFLFITNSDLLTADIQPVALETYKNQYHQKSNAQEQFIFVLQTLQSQQNPLVLSEAITNLVRLSGPLNQNEKALATLENLQKTLTQNKQSRREITDAATLQHPDLFKRYSVRFIPTRKITTALKTQVQTAQARLLMRLGKEAAALAGFQKNLAAQQYPNALKEMKAAWLETGREFDWAIWEYRFNCDDRYTEAFRHYYQLDGDLNRFFNILLRAAKAHPQIRILEEIYPQLTSYPNRPGAQKIAKSLCLAAVGRYAEAYALLQEIENQLNQQAAVSGYDETGDIPLYYALIGIHEGKDFAAVRTEFRQFMDRNRSRPFKILMAALEIVYGLFHNTDYGKPRVKELTPCVIAGEILTNESIRNTLPVDRVASVYDMQAMSLAWSGQGEEALSLHKYVVDHYYPHTLAGANSAMNLCMNEYYSDNHVGKAIQRMKQILAEAPFDEIVPFSRNFLANLYLLQGERQKALEQLQEVINRADMFPYGTWFQAKKEALALREKLINASDPKP